MKNPKVSTEFYDPQFFTGGPSERSRTMFGDADIQGNLTSGFSYQDLLKFLDAGQWLKKLTEKARREMARTMLLTTASEGDFSLRFLFFVIADN